MPKVFQRLRMARCNHGWHKNALERPSRLSCPLRPAQAARYEMPGLNGRVSFPCLVGLGRVRAGHGCNSPVQGEGACFSQRVRESRKQTQKNRAKKERERNRNRERDREREIERERERKRGREREKWLKHRGSSWFELLGRAQEHWHFDLAGVFGFDFDICGCAIARNRD